ncbi:30S ribosomal protein S6 [Candidatus Gottesmanbacteria bacterium]|nr:30S ribosomal protein S6 [Candidatus Gottesmanbacteria bacterium]
MTHTYELLVISKPEEREDTEKKLTDLIKIHLSEKGLTKKEDLGKKVLAYPINRLNEGHYLLFTLTTESDKIQSFTQKLRSFEAIVRHLLVRRK